MEALRDLGVGLVSGDEGKDLVLALGEFEEGVRGSARTGSREILHQTTGYGRAEDGLAAHDGPDRTQYLGFQGAFQQVAAGTGL